MEAEVLEIVATPRANSAIRMGISARTPASVVRNVEGNKNEEAEVHGALGIPFAPIWRPSAAKGMLVSFSFLLLRILLLA